MVTEAFFSFSNPPTNTFPVPKPALPPWHEADHRSTKALFSFYQKEEGYSVKSITAHSISAVPQQGKLYLSLYLFVNNATLLKQVLPWDFIPQRMLLTVSGPICL